MNKFILNSIGVLLSTLMLFSCDDSGDILDDKNQDPVKIVQPNDHSPVVKIFNNVENASITIGDEISLKCTIESENQLDAIEWTIEYASDVKQTNYSYTKIAGVKLDAKSVDYRVEPLLLANTIVEDMAEGSYSIDIKVLDQEGNKTEFSYSLELKNKLNAFSYDGEIYKVETLKSSLRNVGTDMETCILQVCAEGSSVNSKFISKGSVVWFNLKAHDELGFPKIGSYTIPSDELNATVYLKKGMEDRVFKTLNCCNGSLRISRQSSNDKQFNVEFELFTEENEKIVGNCLQEIDL